VRDSGEEVAQRSRQGGGVYRFVAAKREATLLPQRFVVTIRPLFESMFSRAAWSPFESTRRRGV